MNAIFVRWATLTVATLALVGCSRHEPAPEPVRAVRTMVLGAESAGFVHEFPAEVRARTESRLGFRVGGKLLARPADLGQHVKAGEVLARIDGSDLQLGLDAAQAGVRAAQSSYELAAADFARYKSLREQGFIGAAELERRESSVKAQRAALEQARAQAGVQTNQAGYATLTAPASGVITVVSAEPGAVLPAGGEVVRLAHDGDRDVVFAVPEDGLTGMRALLGRRGALQVRPWGAGEAVTATVREVAAAADPVTRTYLVKADIGAIPWPLGRTVTVLMALPRQEAVLKLPLTAVTRQQGQSAVWVVDRASMTVQPQTIVVGGADGNAVVVASGLSAGQTVVTAGVHVLSPGQKVRFYEPLAAGAGASAPR